MAVQIFVFAAASHSSRRSGGSLPHTRRSFACALAHGGAPRASRRLFRHKILCALAHGGACHTSRRTFSHNAAIISPTPPTLMPTVMLNCHKTAFLIFYSALCTLYFELIRVSER